MQWSYNSEIKITSQIIEIEVHKVKSLDIEKNGSRNVFKDRKRSLS